MEADEIAQAYADLMGDVDPETGERALRGDQDPGVYDEFVSKGQEYIDGLDIPSEVASQVMLIFLGHMDHVDLYPDSQWWPFEEFIDNTVKYVMSDSTSIGSYNDLYGGDPEHEGAGG